MLKVVFCVTYGEPIGHDIAAQTVRDDGAQDPPVVLAKLLGMKDLREFYMSGGTSNPEGFYLAANGVL
ncbi:hypothetical protein [Mesorhizobium mediterraneum]|uniref:hypothetical protein n=1 Tax=Mesorhizobium mediterraneum TaxID=43617 RepID=UPI0017828A61|nr:hypothetical protein [Mesorhizobium mediterraneum]